MITTTENVDVLETHEEYTVKSYKIKRFVLKKDSSMSDSGTEAMNVKPTG